MIRRRLPTLVLLLSITIALLIAAPRRTNAADSESERLARLEAAVQALQSQNAELKREIASLKNEKPKKGATPHSATAAGDNKSFVGRAVAEKEPLYVTPGGKETKLVLGGFVQGQFEAGDVSAYAGRFPGPETSKTKDRFRLRRARISVIGEFAEQFDFKLEGGFETTDTTLMVRDQQGRTLANNTNRTSFGATDVWLNWHGVPEANIKLGQFRAPFGLEQITQDTKLPAIERSLATEALTPERQIGIQLWGKPLANVWPGEKDLLSYSVGIFNGSGRNSTTNDNNEFMYAARVEAQLYSGTVAGQETTVKIGGDYLTSRDERGVNISQTGNLLVNRDGSLAVFVLPAADEREAYGVDGSLHIGPFDVTAEYLNERVRPRGSSTTPDFDAFRANGYYVTAGYYVLPKKLQLVGKWESFNPGQAADDDLKSVTGGINYYIKGDDLKLMADYIHTWSDFRHHNPQFGDDEFDEVFLRMQVIF